MEGNVFLLVILNFIKNKLFKMWPRHQEYVGRSWYTHVQSGPDPIVLNSSWISTSSDFPTFIPITGLVSSAGNSPP